MFYLYQLEQYIAHIDIAQIYRYMSTMTMDGT